MQLQRSLLWPTRVLALAAAAWIAGCTVLPQQPAEPAAPAETAPEPPPVVTAPEPAPPPRAVPPPPPPPQRTAVLLSDDIPAFTSIAEKLLERLGADHVTIHNLDGSRVHAQRIKAAAAEADQLVAIGLLAATIGKEIEGKRMVFCQVFNYRDYDLVTASSKGVSLLPPFEAQLDEWLAVVPQLMRVGIVVGPNQEPLVEEIGAAVAARGLELAARTVSSDKEALYEFKRLTPEIQGLWLLPDNRILSPEVVREIMSYSARHRKQVVVFGDNLLDFGALMSVSSEPDDVAAQVVSRLREASAGGAWNGPPMRPLTTVRIEINAEVARYLDFASAETATGTQAENR